MQILLKAVVQCYKFQFLTMMYVAIIYLLEQPCFVGTFSKRLTVNFPILSVDL